MAHYGRYRHSRISRILKARHPSDSDDGDIADVDDGAAKILEALNAIQSPVVTPPDIDALSDDPCDPLQNVTCPGDVPDTAGDVLSKRQAAETPQSTLVETVIQVVDQNSQTLWQTTAQDLPMTISDPSFGAVTVPTSTSASTSEPVSAEIPLPTFPTNLVATQPITSPTQSLAPTTKQTQTAAISSPKVSLASSSAPFTSTPLVASTSSATSLATTTSVFAAEITSWSTSSSTGSYPDSSTQSNTSSSTSTGLYGNAEETGSGTGTATGAVPSTSDSQSSSGSGSSSKADTPKIVGGVIGSVAGLAMIFLILFYLLRRRKFFQQKGILALPGDDAVGSREVAERHTSDDPLFTATYFAPAFVKRWRNSTMTAKTESTVSSSNPSERGFQKISGRKIPPVLTHGGDGYGGGLDGDSPTIPGFPPISPDGGGPFSSPTSHAPPVASPYGMPLDTNYTRETDEFTTPTRPKAVHLPLSSSVNFGSPTTVNASHPVVQAQSAMPVSSPPSRPDGLGRSLPSYDGSRGSRFTESLDL